MTSRSLGSNPSLSSIYTSLDSGFIIEIESEVKTMIMRPRDPKDGMSNFMARPHINVQLKIRSKTMSLKTFLKFKLNRGSYLWILPGVKDASDTSI